MLDDLREEASSTSLFEDDEFAYDLETTGSRGLFLGMTAPQRFILAFMLLLMVCVLGTFCLLVTETVVPPFL